MEDCASPRVFWSCFEENLSSMCSIAKLWSLKLQVWAWSQWNQRGPQRSLYSNAEQNPFNLEGLGRMNNIATKIYSIICSFIHKPSN